MCARIARDIHAPITEVMAMPLTELRTWAHVYEMEAEALKQAEEHANEQEETEPTGAQMFNFLGGEFVDKKKGFKKCP